MKPVSCHRHQRSGALDFDAFLLTAEEEDQRASSDQENKSAPLQVCPFSRLFSRSTLCHRASSALCTRQVHSRPGATLCIHSLVCSRCHSQHCEPNTLLPDITTTSLQDVPDAMFVTATDEDVRGSGDTVDTVVVHSPSMRDVPQDGPESCMNRSKLSTLDSTAAASCQQPPTAEGGLQGGVNASDAVDASCASHPLNMTTSSVTMDQLHVDCAHAPLATADEAVGAPESPPAGSPIAAPATQFEAAGSSAVFAPMDDAVMQSPIAAIASDGEPRPVNDGEATGAVEFQFDVAMGGTTPVAFGEVCAAGVAGPAQCSYIGNDIEMAGSSLTMLAAPAEAAAAPSSSCMEGDRSSSPEPTGTANTPGGASARLPARPTPAPSEGASPHSQTSPAVAAAHAYPAVLDVPKQPGSPQSREATPPVQADQSVAQDEGTPCLLYTSPSPRDRTRSRMPSSA